jgi:hypothetical protein
MTGPPVPRPIVVVGFTLPEIGRRQLIGEIASCFSDAISMIRWRIA